jgi:hypothetical protein
MSPLYANLKNERNKMITLTFETWEEFDKAIANIVVLETELVKDK